MYVDLIWFYVGNFQHSFNRICSLKYDISSNLLQLLSAHFRECSRERVEVVFEAGKESAVLHTDWHVRLWVGICVCVCVGRSLRQMEWKSNSSIPSNQYIYEHTWTGAKLITATNINLIDKRKMKTSAYAWYWRAGKHAHTSHTLYKHSTYDAYKYNVYSQLLKSTHSPPPWETLVNVNIVKLFIN